MQLSKQVKPFVVDLLQSRLKGTLKEPSDVLRISAKYRPPQGFTNADWHDVCDFILLLKDADNILRAKELANKYGLVLENNNEMV